MKLRKFLAAALAASLLLASGCDASVTAGPPSAPPSEGPADPTLVVIPAGDDEPAGLILDEYAMRAGTSTPVTFDSCEGDTDILNLTGIRRRNYDVTGIGGSVLFEFMFDAKMPVAFTAEKWEDGEVAEDAAAAEITAADRAGFVEKYKGENRWEWYSYAGFRDAARSKNNYGLPADDENYMPLSETPVGLGEDGEVCFTLPFAGIYRYTLYFRESLDSTPEHCTTGDELYSITFRLTVPKSDRDFDVLSVTGVWVDEPTVLHDWQGYKERVDNCYVYIVVSYNFTPETGELLQLGLTAKKCSVEMLENGEWKTLKDAVRPDSIQTGTRGLYCGLIAMDLPDPEGTYRLTVHFEGCGDFPLILNWAE